MFPGPTADQSPGKPMIAALTRQAHMEDSLTKIEPPLQQTIEGSCQHDMAPHIQIKMEHETSSSMEPVIPTSTLLPQKIETVVRLSQLEPVVASRMHIKTEDEYFCNV